MFSIVLEATARAIRNEREKDRIQMENEETKVSLFADNIILYPPRQLPQLIYSFIKVEGYKINMEKSVTFLFTNNKYTKKYLGEIIPFIKPKSTVRNLIREVNDFYSKNLKTV